jgi:uncharacterized protein YodC (DUF2158 family)
MSFEVGDTVQLKSGGPDMTVIKTGTAGGDRMVWCAWFEGTKDAYGPFPPEALKVPSEPPEVLKGASAPAQTVKVPAEPQPNAAPAPQPTETHSAPALGKTKTFTGTFSKQEPPPKAHGSHSRQTSTWALPGERTKNGVPHMVPLSTPVRDMLKGLLPQGATEAKRAIQDRRAISALVLPGTAGTPFSGWSRAKKKLDDAIVNARAKAASARGAAPAPLAPWTVHDLRRTVATGLQRLGVRLEVTEAVLNHISGSRGGIAGVYQRHDWAAEKRAALDAWAAHALAIVEGRVAGLS